MKFTCSTAALSTELTLALGAASQKNELVQKNLTHVQLTALENGTLRILTHSIEIAFEAVIEAEVDRPGVILMDAKKLTDHVSSQAGDKIVFDRKEDGASRVSVRSGKNRSTIPCFPESNLPNIEMDAMSAGKMSLDALSLMLNRVAFAISSDDAKYTITAAKLETSEAGVTAVATDVKKLSLAETAVDGMSGSMEALIPKKTISELIKIHAKSAGSEVEIAYNKKGAMLFLVGHRTLFSLGVTGRFPRYDVCFMKGDRQTVLVKGNALKATIERVGNFADNQSSALTFTVSDNSLSVKASHHTFGESEEDIDIEYEGPEVSVVLSSKNIMDFLRLASDKNIELSFLNSMSPVEFRVEGDPTWTVVVMPMKL